MTEDLNGSTTPGNNPLSLAPQIHNQKVNNFSTRRDPSLKSKIGHIDHFIGHPKPGFGGINDEANGSPLKAKGLIPSEGTLNLLPQGNNTGNSQ